MTRALLFLAVVSGPGPAALAQKFRLDDPVLVDHDDASIDEPAALELSTAYDALEHTLFHRPKKGGPVKRALDANTLGEVPDSSWFQNRIGQRDLKVEELVRGSDTRDGPRPPLRVTRGKGAGITPGFVVEDARGDTWFVKFDPLKNPHLASAADVIGSNFFHAIGYNVPENVIARFRRDQIEVARDARFTRGALRRPMVEADVDEMLARVHREPDGGYRAVFSLAAPGKAIGQWKFRGRREDDPNDLWPHEDRRLLRGYRVFCAWLHHDDSRANNTLESYVSENGRRFVKRYLIDFSSILGAGSDEYRQIAPQSRRAGNEYLAERAPILKALGSFGIWDRPWRNVAYLEFPEIGRIEADYFHPHRWRPEYPNPAFERMQPEDAFWAARIVGRFTDEQIRAIVHTGEFADALAERHLADVVIRRRDKTVDYYLRCVAPLDAFRLSEDGALLLFDHLGEPRGLGTVEGYDVEWFRFDNVTGKLDPVAGSSSFAAGRSVPVPADEAPYLTARLRARSTVPAWRLPVEVTVRQVPRRIVVGVERAGGDWP